MAITDEIPRSRITLTYRTNVSGEPEEVTLPFRVLIMGDLSKGTSSDRRLPLDKRQIRRLDGKNLGEVMDDMGLSVSMSVRNRINPRVSESIDVKLPITSVRSFQPAEVARHVPRVRALLLLRKLLLEAQATFDNRKEFRNLLREATHSDESMKALTQELANFAAYRIPAAKLRLVVPPEMLELANLEIRRALLVPDPLRPLQANGGAKPVPNTNGKTPPAEAAKSDAAAPADAAGDDTATAAPSTEGMIRTEEQIVERSQYNQAIRLKPGLYELRAYAPNYGPWSKVVAVTHDETVEATVGPLKALS